jgi:hypothetical protein
VILGPQDRAYSAADPLIIWKPLQEVAGNDRRGIGIALTSPFAVVGAAFADIGAAVANVGAALAKRG